MSWHPLDAPCCDVGDPDYALHCGVCDCCSACCTCHWMIRYQCDCEQDDGTICGIQFSVPAEWDDDGLTPAHPVHCPTCDYEDPLRLGEEIDELAA